MPSLFVSLGVSLKSFELFQTYQDVNRRKLPATSAATVSTAAAETTASATAAAFAGSHRTSFVHSHCATVEHSTVELLNRVSCLRVSAHFDESKAFALA
jgi:hypothetical protein